ncbi:hypothetical protein [Bifidobacterium callitrichidarum]|uniref:Uridine kinase n=1 Tax=Bifidobacterium callitrichidarum TaxID=2052941 RepID=A0A2U2NCT0_9BIFI|nr:hypothetical protein [Bifidobacterium callitrichidarum]PWG66923.1 hypothetical protein DF196_01520 [Bifidobacterium callitrichidarum]
MTIDFDLDPDRRHTVKRPSRRRTLAAVIASGLCLTALAGCSMPFTNQATDTGDSGTTTGSGSNTTDNLTTDVNAKKFVSCLTGKGFEAQAAAAPGVPDQNGKMTTPTTKNMVMLRMLDANGQPVESGNDGMSVSTDSTTQQMYANAMFTSIDYGTVWVAFKDSTALAGSPYESKRQDYADCEAENPNFAQPAQDLNQTPSYSDADKQAALDYAKKARSKGFSWVADPAGDEPTTILIPKTVGEDELRRFFKECPVGDARITFGFDGTAEDFGYDYTKVMDEAMGVAS